MKQQIAIWKQLLAIALIGLMAFGIWHQREVLGQLTGLSLENEQSRNQSGQSRRKSRNQRSSQAPVIVARVDMKKAIDRIIAIGNGRARHSVTLFPQVSGIVTHVSARTGDLVQANAPLFTLNDAQARIAVKLAETKLANARRTLDRLSALLKRNAVAEATADAARTDVQTAELELAKAREDLADRMIRAPFTGHAGIPQVEPGDRVTDNTALVNLDDRSEIIVEFDIAEIYLSQLAPGQQIAVQTAAFPSRGFTGKITGIDSRIDRTTRAVHIRAIIANKDDLLRPGMSFTVTLTIEGATYPVVPELALHWERGGPYVWRITNGKSEKVRAKVVKRENGHILIDAPLDADEIVVIEGAQRLRPGRDVRYEEPAMPNGRKAGI